MPLLEIDNLHVHFRTDDGLVRAVDGVSFSLEEGETLGIVGESGSGKSVTNLAMLGLLPQPPAVIPHGRALFQGRDLLTLDRRELAQIRGNRIAMIFQDPLTSLNPFLTVGDQLAEITRQHLRYGGERARKYAIEMLERVGIPAAGRRIDDYPHQFSGGMRQRVMIAMALSCRPNLLIADEPTTALDVTIQAQILELMKDLQQRDGMAIILITHDLGVVANVCRRVNVMYAGRFVEMAATEELFASPRHPYTLGLLESIPRLTSTADRLTPITGQPPDLAHLPAGCAFEPRCPFARPACRVEIPALQPREDGRRFACVVDVRTAPRHTPLSAGEATK